MANQTPPISVGRATESTSSKCPPRQPRSTRHPNRSAPTMLHTQFVKAPQPFTFFHAEREVQIVAQVCDGQLVGNAHKRRLPLGNFIYALTPWLRAAFNTAANSPTSAASLAIHIANTKGRPVHRVHCSPRSQTSSQGADRVDSGVVCRLAPWSPPLMARSPINNTASAFVVSGPHPIGRASRTRSHATHFGQQNLRERRASTRTLV